MVPCQRPLVGGKNGFKQTHCNPITAPLDAEFKTH